MSNRIIVITMIGQWSDGLPLHTANIAWALNGLAHRHVVVTTQEIARRYADEITHVNFHSIDEVLPCGFIPFWDHFQRLWENIRSEGKYCLFMEQDIWLTHPLPNLSFARNRLFAILPASRNYHHLFIGGRKAHSRVWEGGLLLPKDVIQQALDEGVSFGRERPWANMHLNEYLQRFATPITLSGPDAHDTMDDLTFYCGLKARTSVQHLTRQAIHIRGPEAVHRQLPRLVERFNSVGADAIRQINYDPWMVAAGFYLAGTHDTLELDVGNPDSRDLSLLRSLRTSGEQWMGREGYRRLQLLLQSFRKG